MGNAGEETPRFKSRGELFATERGAQQMTLEREVLRIGPKHDRNDCVRSGKRKTSHPALAFTRGLMASMSRKLSRPFANWLTKDGSSLFLLAAKW
ncbi:hypothetical protein OKW43_007643 [Paraburkholderia sp. WC7.3g]